MLKTTASRLASFSVGLALAAGVAGAIGAATGATPPFQDCLKVAAANAGFGNQAMADTGHGAPPMIEAVPGSDGLHAQLAGLRLAPLSRTVSAGASTTWRFRIIGCDGKPVRHFDGDNTKLLHLIVVRTDSGGYQHLHPTLEGPGRPRRSDPPSLDRLPHRPEVTLEQSAYVHAPRTPGCGSSSGRVESVRLARTTGS